MLIRAEIIEPSLTYQISVPAISGISESDVTVLQDTGSKSAQNFLKDISPNLCLWTGDSLDTPLFSLNHHVSRPVALINPKIKMLLGRSWIWRKTVMRQFLRPVCYSFVERLEDVKDLRALGLPAKKIEVIGPLLSEREKDLSSKLVVLMAPDKCADMAKKGWQVVSDGAVAIDRLVDFILDKMNLEK